LALCRNPNSRVLISLKLEQKIKRRELNDKKNAACQNRFRVVGLIHSIAFANQFNGFALVE
jgi:hypothetical protein